MTFISLAQTSSCIDCDFHVWTKLEGHYCDLPETKPGQEGDTSTEGDTNKLEYCVTDVPPWYLCILLGIQVPQQTPLNVSPPNGDLLELQPPLNLWEAPIELFTASVSLTDLCKIRRHKSLSCLYVVVRLLALPDGVWRDHRHSADPVPRSVSAAWRPHAEPPHQHHLPCLWYLHLDAGPLWYQVSEKCTNQASLSMYQKAAWKKKCGSPLRFIKKELGVLLQNKASS